MNRWIQQTDCECKEVSSFREEEGRKVSEGEEEGQERARKRLIDLGKSSKTCPQFSDSKRWLAVSEVELVRQLARRIWSASRSLIRLHLYLNRSFPNNPSQGWSNSDAAVYCCRSTALTNNNLQYVVATFLSSGDEIVAAPAHSEMFPSETQHHLIR